MGTINIKGNKLSVMMMIFIGHNKSSGNIGYKYAHATSSQNFSHTISYPSFILLTSTCLRRWNRQSVPKRRHIKSRRRVITQKKAYNIQNTAKA